KVLQTSMFDKQRAMLKMKELNVNELIENVVNTFKLKVSNYGGSITTGTIVTHSTAVRTPLHVAETT
ncbi:MAG TPA: hypothetical protein O0X92_06730, partial [Methanocorpusculum sp.]|nr:hypothetical protein [Methanocorpusculum sp.]